MLVIADALCLHYMHRMVHTM
uniref:Uncharacterized protein n=1 Tax=Arundo donax TaxID=35708 RepID=A0A0A9C848_ARUDO